MTRQSGSMPAAPPTAEPDPALDDALARVRELSLRLWAVREAHLPSRSLLGRTRCRTCAQPYPCPTVAAAGPPRVTPTV